MDQESAGRGRQNGQPANWTPSSPGKMIKLYGSQLVSFHLYCRVQRSCVIIFAVTGSVQFSNNWLLKIFTDCLFGQAPRIQICGTRARDINGGCMIFFTIERRSPSISQLTLSKPKSNTTYGDLNCVTGETASNTIKCMLLQLGDLNCACAFFGFYEYCL